jgi:hypothetical protein
MLSAIYGKIKEEVGRIREVLIINNLLSIVKIALIYSFKLINSLS